MKKIMIAAAGTGGHIFPGIAIAKGVDPLREEVIWVGTSQGMENKWVPAAGLRLATIPMTGLRGKGLLRLLKAPYLLWQSVRAAKALIQKESPNLIIGMGGYVSAPMGIAAKLSGIPLLIHEQNAVQGSANRLLSLWATHIFESFPETFKPSSKLTCSGSPVRQAILDAASLKSSQASEASLNVLVLGGSQGAMAINTVMPEVMALLAEKTPVLFWHQTGEKSFAVIESLYREKKMTPYCLSPFIADMAQAYLWADLIICRAGAMTVAEVSTMGVPAIFIPAPQAIDDHQTANAKRLVNAGAALYLPQSALSPDALVKLIRHFAEHRQALSELSLAAETFSSAHRDAVSHIMTVARRVMG